MHLWYPKVLNNFPIIFNIIFLYVYMCYEMNYFSYHKITNTNLIFCEFI